MPRLFLFHLLGVCLLLNQFSRAVAAKWKDDVIKLCGCELVRAQIAICGMSTWSKTSLSQEDAPLKPKLVTEIVPSFINKDTETIIIMLVFIVNLPLELKAALSERQPVLPELQQYVPALKDSNLSFEEFKKIIHNKQTEATESNSSELKYLVLDTHSQKKRRPYMALFEKCCLIGCTKRSLAKYC
uniref:Relaxin 1 n=1 Tax=Nomascus leucogenys TaxID=61853 RepID=G1RCK3_NOMLE